MPLSGEPWKGAKTAEVEKSNEFIFIGNYGIMGHVYIYICKYIHVYTHTRTIHMCIYIYLTYTHIRIFKHGDIDK